jgi:hypothetical protein
MEALALTRPRPARMLVRQPLVWLASAAIGVGTSAFAGVLIALAVLGGAAGATAAVLRLGRVRRWLERSAAREARREQREARERQLENAGVSQLGLDTATALVDQLVATQPALATHLELEELLDHYVELELAAARYAGVLAGRSLRRPVPESSSTRRQIRGRALELHHVCELRLAVTRDEMAGIVELLQLLVERTFIETEEPEADPIADRLALLGD